MERWKLVTYAVVALGVGCAVVFQHFYEERARARWDRVTAHIENPRVEYKKSGTYKKRKSRLTCFFDVVYAYDGQQYRHEDDDEDDACTSKAGQSVVVFVNPDAPNEYVLD